MRLTCSGLVIGEAPLSAKAQAGHGAFLNWCDVIVGFTPRHAQCYLDAALLFRRHGDVEGLLPPTAAQDLGASSVGEDTVDEVLAHVRRGERVTVEWSRQRSDATRRALAGRYRFPAIRRRSRP